MLLTPPTKASWSLPSGRLQRRRFDPASLRLIAQGRVFSGRTLWQLTPVAVAISRLSFALPVGGAGPLFSERVSLRSSGHHRFGMVLEIRTFRVTCEPLRKEVLRLLSDRREHALQSIFRRSYVARSRWQWRKQIVERNNHSAAKHARGL